MQVLFDGDVWVHYGFIYLQPQEEFVEVDHRGAREGQANGLVGAGQAGVLLMTTGLHTGTVPVRVEGHDAEPPLSSDWEDVVEVPFTPEDPDYEVRAFQDSYPLSGVLRASPHRARWHAQGMEAANQADTRGEDEPPIDRYLLQLWPAAPAPDAVVRQGSAQAAYWHSVATKTSAPDHAAEQ